MKKIKKTLIYLLIIEIIMPTIVIAHSGRTDSNGGHYDRSTGEYHYHHGYPAHQHINGVCPYAYDDKTSSSSSISNTKISSKTKTSKQNDNISPPNYTILYIFIGLFFILSLIFSIIDRIKNKIFSKKKNNDIITQQVNKASKSHSTKGNYICPRCGGKTIIKYGKYGAFIGCSNYPYCKYTKNIRKY